MVGQTIFGKYEITQHLKDTNFCEIYLAQDLGLPKKDLRVVKCLKQSPAPPFTWQQGKDCLDAEAKILNCLKHDRIPQLFQNSEENSQFYLVQDYIEGHDLSEEIKPHQRLSEDRAIHLLQEIIEIVSFIHKKNIIHCDINPSNLIRCTSSSKLVLIDFGSAKQIGISGNNSANRVQASIPEYAPVEQKAGNPQFSSDIYAVGIIAMQGLTGVAAKDFPRAPNTSKILWTDETKPSPKLQEIIEKMVHPNFRERHQSAEDVLAALTKLSVSHRTQSKSFIKAAMAGDATAVAQLVVGAILGIPGFIVGMQQMQQILNPPAVTVKSDDFKTYANSQYKFTIKHPKDWKPQEIGINGEVVKFVHQPSQANVLVSVKALSGWLSLEEYTKQSMTAIENEFLDEKKQVKKYKIEEKNGNASLAKNPAFKVIYAGKDASNNSLKMMEIWNLKDKRAYIITYEASAAKYDELNKIVEEMVDSFAN